MKRGGFEKRWFRKEVVSTLLSSAMSTYVRVTLMCVRDTIYVSSCYMCLVTTMCPHTTTCVLILLYMCPHTTICESAYYYICVRMQRPPPPDTARHELKHISGLTKVSTHTNSSLCTSID
jgi:hypothetical protein